MKEFSTKINVKQKDFCRISLTLYKYLINSHPNVDSMKFIFSLLTTFLECHFSVSGNLFSHLAIYEFLVRSVERAFCFYRVGARLFCFFFLKKNYCRLLKITSRKRKFSESIYLFWLLLNLESAP